MPAVNPFPEKLPDDKAEAIARRRTALQRAAAGLFADHVPPVTPEMVQAAAKEHHDRFQATADELEARGKRLREVVAGMVTPEALSELDERRAVLPQSSEYSADFWRRVLVELLVPFEGP